MKLLINIEAGKSYMLSGLIRKIGEHCLWAVSTTTVCEWAPFEVPDTLLHMESKHGSRGQETTSLAKALISTSTSTIKAKIVQVCILVFSLKKYT